MLFSTFENTLPCLMSLLSVQNPTCMAEWSKYKQNKHGLVVIGGDSRSRGREFESQSGRYFLHLSKKYCWNKPRRNEKEAGDSPFYIFCFQIITISIWSLEDDPIATYFFNIWPFTTMILCVIAYFFPNAILS